MGNHTKRKDKTRVTTYRFEGFFNESIMERIMERARTAGVISEFDTGRGTLVWFQGMPGKDLRDLRERVRSLVKDVEE